MRKRPTHVEGVPVLGEAERDRRAVIAARKRRFKMEDSEYRSRIRAQGNQCAVCKEPFTGDPHVDHDHGCCPETPTCGLCTRGLLCHRCNSMLGMARDRPEVLTAGVEYLLKYRAPT